MTTRRIIDLILLTSSFALAAAAPARAADALPWFHTYTVPGNYVVGGVDLVPLNFQNGVRTRRIVMGNQVPANAKILAAYLFWETMWRGTNPAVDDSDLAQLRGLVKFRGQSVTGIKSSTLPLSSQCRGIGDGQWISIMKADVLRLLPKQLDQNNEWTGRYLVNDADLTANSLGLHTVGLPDSGIFNFAPQTAGASLLVIYEDPNPLAELRSIVVYDGIHVQGQGQETLLTMKFLDAENDSAASLTYIGGSGWVNLTDQVYLGSQRIDTGNPFPSGGLLTDRAWSNPTFSISSAQWAAARQDDSQYGESVATRITHTHPSLFYDCLSTAAVVLSVEAQDEEAGAPGFPVGDGLPDKLEDTSGGLLNPAGVPYPDINAMGASSGHRDAFIEVASMRAGPGTGYGKGSPYYSGPGGTVVPYLSTDPDGHDHRPSRQVLVDFADALLNPPAGHPPIYVHFDVGDAGYLSPAGHSTLFVPPGLARGGESVLEEECVGDFPDCRFPGYAGLVSFPAGLHFLGMAAVDNDTGDVIDNPNDPDDPSSAWCQVQTLDDCRRLFDLNRDGLFHLMFFGHGRGTPRSLDPCRVIADQTPAPATGTDAAGIPICASGHEHNPDHYLVKSVSGVSQLAGWLHLVTLGLWDNFTGTERMQTQTAMHEFLHGLGIWHGGRAPAFAPLPDGRVQVKVTPNCNPYYFSVANYMYQATGVSNGTGGLFARPSGETSGDIDEQSLTDGLLGLPFRASWYAPLAEGTAGDIFGLVPATRHCDGTPLIGEGDTVRLDANLAPSLNWNIDWNGDGAGGTAPPQDVNFDGKQQSALGGGTPLQGFNDWEAMALNRLGTGPNMAGFSVGLGLDFGGLDFGGLDFGGLDFGGLDFGGLDFGGLDFGGLDFGGLDFGGLDFGGLDFGGLDFGGLDFGGLDFGGLEDEIRAELTYEIVVESIAPGGSTAPNNLTACVIGGTGTGPNCAIGSAPLHRHRLNWEAPTVGSPDFYKGSRVWDPTGVADVPAPGSVVSDVGTTPDAATTTLVDTEELPDGQRFIYWVRASVNGEFGSLSNFAIVTAENTAPVAVDDSGALYSIQAGSPETLFPSVLANDTDVDSAASSLRAVLVAGPLHGTLILNTDGTFLYTPAPGFTGTDTFTYQANNGTWTQSGSSVPMSANSNTGTVTIEVTPPPATPIQFLRTDLWLSTSSSNRKYDLKAEVLKNGVVVKEAIVLNQALGFGTTFNKAIYKSIGDFAATAVDFTQGDTLSVRVSMKLNAGSPGGQNASGATRLWYNVPTPPPANNSHLHATIGGAPVRYYLITPFTLQKDGTVAGPTQYIDAIVYKPGYTVLGTWSITGP